MRCGLRAFSRTSLPTPLCSRPTGHIPLSTFSYHTRLAYPSVRILCSHSLFAFLDSKSLRRTPQVLSSGNIPLSTPLVHTPLCTPCSHPSGTSIWPPLCPHPSSAPLYSSLYSHPLFTPLCSLISATLYTSLYSHPSVHPVHSPTRATTAASPSTNPRARLPFGCGERRCNTRYCRSLKV